MKRLIALLAWLLVATLAVEAPAHAAETYVCWYDEAGANGVGDAMLNCRINGSLLVEFPSDPPVVTVPDVGFDLSGPCWYRRTGAWSGWVLATVFADLAARLWWSPSGDPAGPYLGDATYRACVSEPRPTPPPITAVWDFIERYPFGVPDPAVAPAGRGVTGLPIYVGVDPPDPVTRRIVSPLGGWIDVEISVATVTVDWGDESRASFAPGAWRMLSGWPDGDVHHLYEATGIYGLSVSYDWRARWRMSGQPWRDVAVTPTVWSTPYPVDELVGRRTS